MTEGDTMENLVEIQNLTKYYGKSRGIIDVSFSIKQGEIFGFIGPNGAGKSTTIRTLLSLIHPTSGSATIFGKDTQKYGCEIRKKIGYLPSEVFYYDGMKVMDLLLYSASFYGKPDKKRISYLADIMDLNLTRKIEDLSYGNKKKVGIVQGLLHNPELIILDEPTSGLDPLMQQNFFQLIKEENKKGATVLFSSHILPEVQKLCDRVGIIKDGKMICVESMSDMLDTKYKKIKLVFSDKDITNLIFPDGTNALEQNQNEVSFLYKGNINDILKFVSTYSLQNILIEEPDLEEIFLHYYSK